MHECNLERKPSNAKPCISGVGGLVESSPALHIMEAMSLVTMDPLFLILHCLL